MSGINTHEWEARGVDRGAANRAADAPFAFFEGCHDAGGVATDEYPRGKAHKSELFKGVLHVCRV